MIFETVSGKPVHPIGIGTWGIGGTWETVRGNEQEGIDGIRYSVSRGQNHIDSGEIYGQGYTDEIIGHAIAGLPREDLYLSDKLWETSVDEGLVEPAVKKMLKKLKTDYLDLIYIHKPWDNFPWRKAIPQIDALIDKGIIRHFGASNLDVGQMKEVMRISKYPLVVSQLYFNVLNKIAVDDEVKAYCTENNIKIIAYRPLEQGKVFQNEIVKQIGIAHKASPSQVALAWLFAQGALPIPGATSKKFIDENLRALDLKLSSQELQDLDKL